VEVRRFPVRGAQDIAAALNLIEKEGVDAIKQGGGPAVTAEIPRILAFATEHRLPTVFLFPGPVERGGLLSYAPILTEYGDRAAVLVDRILKGANPADIPFEYPTRYELTINLKTANALGIKLPQAVLLRADRLIE
jgi:putative tryptophan/tyrosine transport system substrate-binding protein